MQLNALFHAILAGVAISAASVSAACVNVSVEADATYCINGPICSGSGSTPAGSLCPTKGAVAVKDCSNNKLPSWTSAGACVAPADAVCAKIKTGAWGCVYTAKTTANATSTGMATPAPTTTAKSSNTTTNSTASVTPAPTTTAKLSNTTANSTAVTPAPTTTTAKLKTTTTNSTTAVTPAPTTTTAKTSSTTTNSTAAVTPTPTTTAKSSNTTTNSTAVTPAPTTTTAKLNTTIQFYCSSDTGTHHNGQV
ncbi:hypothetical protein PR003_g22627 [Phytophthora rubi]|uniref:CBM1 domain-containing protein n=1 Tax=Phytophthora rubi TaxID=129364 RepID=A0A6A3J0K1_9STRA|nr:hypothetical protein PR002_g21967 [Phytophthora rubi]KAE8990520.1 hypothetical protein PR001_g21463 [Phytophthora rubi]KAE9301020.1 hypothetical protein PR003_g22627 [Phytophthora rubi]